MMNRRPQSHPKAPGCILSLLVATCLALPVVAAEPDRGEFFWETENRDLRIDDGKSASAIEWFGSLGASYIHAEDGSKIWLTPFSLDASLNRNTTLRIEGDGYAHVGLDGDTTQGFSNVTLIASQVVYRDSVSRVRLGAGASVPGSSGIGSRGAKQRISASYNRQLSSRWAMLVSGRLTRRNQAPRDGERRIEQFGRLQASYTMDEPMAFRLLPRL